MIWQLLQSLFAALSCAFDVAVDLFSSVGFPWQAAVIMMVVVSVVLRLFTARFVGTAIAVSRSEKKKAAASWAKAEVAKDAASAKK